MTRTEALNHDVTDFKLFLNGIGERAFNDLKLLKGEEATDFGRKFKEEIEKAPNLNVLREQIYPYFSQTLDATDIQCPLFKIPYALLYATSIGTDVMDLLKELYTVENIDDRRVTMVPAIFCIEFYLKLSDSNFDFGGDMHEFLKHPLRFLLYHSVKASISDKPTSTIDFKRTMISAFAHDDISLYDNIASFSRGAVTRAWLFILLTTYLYRFDKATGEKVMDGTYIPDAEKFFPKPSWNDEVKFLNIMSEVIKNDSVTRTEFIDNIAIGMLKNMPNALSDRIQDQKFEASMEDVFHKLETYEYIFTYDHKNHASNMFSALRYYVDKMNLEIKDKLLEQYA